MTNNSGHTTTSSFARLLPLSGGNNFRDMGDYQTQDGRKVQKHLLFRSGVMTSLTNDDQAYLDKIGIKTIIDFRSREELEIFPNHWADNNGLNLVTHDYSFIELHHQAEQANNTESVTIDDLYLVFHNALIPQLTALFQNLINNNSPMVINCSAGQDRTGLGAALILSTLGVPWETIIEDYHLSTKYRRPELEAGNLDFEKYADNNPFAELMLRYKNTDKTPKPLTSKEGIPHLELAFNAINNEHGSVENYLNSALGIDSNDITQIQSQYLEPNT